MSDGVALVTGASSGIGAEFAPAYAARPRLRHRGQAGAGVPIRFTSLVPRRVLARATARMMPEF